MLEPDLIELFVRPLHQLEIRYLISGSVAAMIYGEPRFTNDIDLLLFLRTSDVERVRAAYPFPEFYLPPANVIAAESDEAARRLFTSLQQSFVRLRRGMPGQLPPPVEDIDAFAAPHERAGADRALVYSFVGTRDKVEAGLRGFLALTAADELIVTGHIFDHQARLRSFESAAQILLSLAES